jgi:hypothetical protein
MSVNIWEAKEGVKKNDKNVVIFSLRSFGRSDLTSLLAGSGRSRQRNQNKTNMTYDISVNRSGAKVNKNQPKKEARPQRKPAKAAKAAKAASSRPSNDRLVRPKGLPRAKWNSASLEMKKRLIAQGPLVQGQGKRKPNPKNSINNNNRLGMEMKIPSSKRPPSKPQIEQADYGPVDFEWGEHGTQHEI